MQRQLERELRCRCRISRLLRAQGERPQVAEQIAVQEVRAVGARGGFALQRIERGKLGEGGIHLREVEREGRHSFGGLERRELHARRIGDGGDAARPGASITSA